MTGEKAYREIFGETVLERETRRALENARRNEMPFTPKPEWLDYVKDIKFAKNYAGPDIVPELDYVTICGVKVERPEHIQRSIWMRFWEFRSWII